MAEEPITHSLFAISHKPLLGDLAAYFFKIGEMVKGWTLVLGVAATADADGDFPFDLSFPRMPSSLSMAGLTLDPAKVKGDFIHGGIF